jgi:CheY-like chemotaxis protein
VDDDPLILQILTELLDEHGIDSVHACDGRSGLRVLSDELLSFDLLVTDLIMPDLTGVALVMAVRDLGGERDLPILVATSFSDPDRAEALLVAGANAVVDKSRGLAPVAAAARSLLVARGQLEPLEGPAGEGRQTPILLGRIGLKRVKQ